VTHAGPCINPLSLAADAKRPKHPAFERVDTTLGNVKNALRATFHAVREKRAPRYWAEFEYRSNRRFHLSGMIERLVYVAARGRRQYRLGSEL